MQTIKFKTSDGRVIHYFNNPDRKVLHNWDGPALTYNNKSQKDEYYIFGQKMTKEEWLETKRDFNGIPPSKNSAYEQSMLH
jgi:hypothetical protein